MFVTKVPKQRKEKRRQGDERGWGRGAGHLQATGQNKADSGSERWEEGKANDLGVGEESNEMEREEGQKEKIQRSVPSR